MKFMLNASLSPRASAISSSIAENKKSHPSRRRRSKFNAYILLLFLTRYWQCCLFLVRSSIRLRFCASRLHPIYDMYWVSFKLENSFIKQKYFSFWEFLLSPLHHLRRALAPSHDFSLLHVSSSLCVCSLHSLLFHVVCGILQLIVK